jgi:YD repeat-containing protein
MFEAITATRSYDALGRIAYEIDPAKHVTAYAYNAWGERVNVIRYATALSTSGSAFASVNWQEGQAITMAQVAAGLATDSNDRTMFIGYTQLGQRRAVTQMGATYYTSSDALASGNPRTEFAYNAYGDLVKESVLLEGTLGQPSAVWADTHRYYDEAGRNTLTVDAEGYVTRNVYNALGELVEVIEYARAIDVAQRGSALPPALPPSGDAIHGYDRVTRWTYDALGRKASETAVRHFQRSDGSSGMRDVVTEYGYDAEGRLTDVTKDTGPTGVPGTTVTTYDAMDRVVSVQEAARSVVQASAQAVLTGSTANDIASAALYVTTSPYTTLTYDAFGNVVRTWQYANGKVGVAAPVEDAARDRISVIRHDWQGRAVWERNAEQHVVTRTFDAADHVLSVQATLAGNDGRSAKVETTMVYDAVGRQQSSQTLRTELLNGVPQGVVNDGTESVRYNAFGEIVAKGHDLSVRPFVYTYDAAGRLTSSNDTGVVVNYGYNLAGHQLRQWHDTYTSNGTTIALTLNGVDKLGRVLSKRLPSHTANTTDTSTITQRFDRWGNVLQVIDTRGYQTDYRYNAFNQVIYEARPLVQTLSATGQATWQRPINRWFYDAHGQQIGTQDANGNLRRYDYDAAGRLVQSKDALGAVTRHAYDTFGDRRFTQNPLGYLTFSEYDRLGRVVASGDYLANAAGTQRVRADLQRYVINENGDRLEVKDALGYRTRYDYDSRNLLQRSQTEMGVVVTYAYNARGEKISEWRMAGDIFTDREGDVVQAGALTWNYDAFGRVIDHNNLSGRDYDYVYSAGRQSSETSAGGSGISSALDAGRTIEYYANGRIHRITEDSGNFVSTYTYRYDAAGNRTYEEIDTFDASGINGAPGAQVRTITQSVYDSNNRLQRVVQDDAVSDKRVFDLSYDYDTAGNRRRVVAHSGYGPDVNAVPTVNAAPVAVNATLAEKVIRSGQPSEFRWLLTDVFRDAENDALTLPQPTLADGSALPSWLTYRRDLATGELVFTTTAGSSAALNQDFMIRLTASDAAHPGAPATATFVLRVRHNTAPVPVAGAATFTAKTARPWNLSLSAADHFSDPDVGDRLRLTIVSQPGWMQVAGAGSDALHLSATAGSPTTATVVIRATDERGATADKTVTIQFADNAPPVAVAVPGADATLGRPFNWTTPLPQVFTDANGDPLTVTARLSNGNALPGWMQFGYIDQAVPVLQLSGQLPSEAAAGTTYTVRFTAVDGDGASAINDVVVTVRHNRAPVAHAWNGNIQVGQPFDQTVGFASLFTDLEGDALSLQTLWPGGSPLPAWLNVDVNYASRTVRLHGTPSQLPRGPYAFQMEATDVEGLSGTTTLTLTVVNTPPVAAEIPNATGNVGSAFGYPLPPFYDINGDVLSYSATGLPPGLTINPNNHTITGTPTTAGNYAVTVTAHDGYGGAASSVFQLNVGAPAPNRAPRVGVQPEVDAHFFTREDGPEEATHFTLPENTLIDDDGNPLTYTVSKPSWLQYERIPGGGHHFWGVYPGPQRLAFPTITLTASDGQASGSASFHITCEFLPKDHYENGEPVPAEQTSAMAGDFEAMSTPVQTTTHWYTYDAENRIKIDQGVLVNNQILMGSYGTGSVEMMYDAAGRVTAEVNVYGIQRYSYDLRGNRTLEFHNDMPGEGAGSGGISRQYMYDAANRLDLVLSYYGNNAEIQAPLDGEGFPQGSAMNLGGWLEAAEDYTYDADNRLITQWSKKRDYQSIHWQWEVTAEEFHLQHTAWTNDGILATSAAVTYTEFNGAGLNTKYTYHAPSIGWATHTFTTHYEGWAGFQEKQVAGVSSHADYKPTTNTLSYDGYGRLREQRERTEYQNGAIADRSRVYSNTYEGQVLTRRDGTRTSQHSFQQATPPNGVPRPNYLFVHAGGQQQAELKEGGTIRTNNGFSYSPAQLQGLNGTGNYAAGGGKVTVLEGETLQGLAQRIYGSAQLWYVLADANSLSDPAQPLTAGTQLNAPSVNVSSNDAGTFKPYNPNEAIGSTSPSLPYIVPPPKQQCNTLAIIIMVVVAVVVTVYTAGAATGAVLAANGGAAAGTTAAVGGAALTGGVVGTVGGTAVTLSATGAMVVGAAAGAAGAAASMAVGSAMGATSFSWRGVAAGAITGGLTAGLAQFGTIGAAASAGNWGKAAALAVANAGANYAGQKLAGVDTSFSWRSIAASAVSSVVAAKVAPSVVNKLGLESEFANDFAHGVTGGLVSAAVRSSFGQTIHGSDYLTVVADAFGNALGNATVRGVQNWQANRADSSRRDLMQSWAVGDEQQRQQMILDEEFTRASQDLADANARIAALDAEEAALLNGDDGYWDEVGGLEIDIIGGTPVHTATDVRAASIDQWGRSITEYWDDNWFMRVSAKAGLSIIQSANSAYGIATDLQYGRKLQSSIGYAAQNPGAVGRAIAGGLGQWWESPLADKAEGAGAFGMEMLATGGAGLVARLGTAERSFGTALDVAEEAAALHRMADLNAVPDAKHLHFLDDISTTWRGHENAVVGSLQSTLADDFAAKVYLRVELPDGKTYTVIPDGLERAGDSFIIHEAKFSQAKDLLNVPAEQLRGTFTTNQKPAFDAISAGNAKVTLLNSQGGRQLLGDNFRVGMPIQVQPTLNIYVNTPQGVIKRTWP